MTQLKYGTKEFLRYVIPSTASMLVFSLYTIVDGIFVAHGVGEDALAAVNIAMPFINLLFAVSVLFSVGGSTLVAIHIGRGEILEARRTATQNTLTVGAVGFIIMAATQLFLQPIAELLGASQSTLAYVMDYLRIVSCFSICFMMSYSMEVLVKPDGFPLLATVGVVTCSLIHILLDYIFVLRLHWGIRGAAFATGIAQAASMLFYLCHFLSKRTNLKPLLQKPDFRLYGRILPLGASEFANEISLALMILLYNRVVQQVIGDKGAVSFAVINYVNNLVLMLFAGVSQGMQPLVSIYYGRGETQHCRGYYRKGLIGSLSLGVLCCAVCVFFAPAVTSLLLERSSEVFDYTAKALRIFSVCFLFAGVNVCSAGYANAMEHPLRAFIISMGRGFLPLFGIMMLLTGVFGGEAVWLSSAVTDGLCLILTAALILPKLRQPA